MIDRELFKGRCPYTDKPCEEWNCNECTVEKAERDYLENKDKAVRGNVMNVEVNFDNLTKEEQEQFNALVEKANKPKSRVWRPEVGESYFAIESSSYANERIVNYCVDSDYDEFNISIGNCFRTREEAESVVEKLKVIAEMKRYIAEHDNVELDWDDCKQEKWYILYYHDRGSVEPDYYTQTQIVNNSLYASSEEILENMIKEIGEDRIKKYYFGVE